MPTVSIILPVYNGGKFVGDTIQTILKQDYSDFELLIVNDGSTDNTFDIVRSVSDPRIQTISLSRNSGIGFARNRGIQEASGKLIAFADADDHWVEEKLSVQIAALDQNPQITLLFSDFENIDQISGTSTSGLSQQQAGLNVLHTKTLSDTLFLILDNATEGLLIANFIATPTMIFRRELIDAVGNLRPNLREAPDYEFVLRCALLNVNMAFHSDVLVQRHKTVQSVTAHPERFSTHALDALDEFEASCIEHARVDLIPLINQRRYRLWQSQLRFHARTGNRQQAWIAFRRSVSYGKLSPRAVLYLMAALAGAKPIEFGNRIGARFL